MYATCVYLNKIHLYLLLLYLISVFCTIDLNLAELEYISDHLHAEECRKLVAALHFKSYDVPNALQQAESKISKDIPCIRLLLHWNSEVNQGKGETHEIVQHRLRQIGRTDLADWLGRTVFHQLGKDLEDSLDNSFKDGPSTTEEHKYINRPFEDSAEFKWNPTEWIMFDTICWFFVIVLSLISFVVLGRVVCLVIKKNRSKRRKYSNKSYRELETDPESESESEDRFDIRNQDSAFKLMGVWKPRPTNSHKT